MSPDCSCLHSSAFSCLGGGLSCSSLQTLVSPGDSRTSGQVPLCTRWPDRLFEYNLSRALPLFSHRQWLPPYMPSSPRWTTGALKPGHYLTPPFLPHHLLWKALPFLLFCHSDLCRFFLSLSPLPALWRAEPVSSSVLPWEALERLP